MAVRAFPSAKGGRRMKTKDIIQLLLASGMFLLTLLTFIGNFLR
ncbi:putative holin-like toxin [Cohnella xylanilytica]